MPHESIWKVQIEARIFWPEFYLNMFFLIMALSQFIPQLQIGYLYTYWGPLGFVLAVTTVREAIDDFRRLVFE